MLPHQDNSRRESPKVRLAVFFLQFNSLQNYGLTNLQNHRNNDSACPFTTLSVFSCTFSTLTVQSFHVDGQPSRPLTIIILHNHNIAYLSSALPCTPQPANYMHA